MLLEGAVGHASLLSIHILALSQELELGEDLGAVVWVPCLILNLLLVLSVKQLEFVFFQPLDSDDLTDGLLLVLAALEKITGHERGEKSAHGSLVLSNLPVL